MTTEHIHFRPRGLLPHLKLRLGTNTGQSIDLVARRDLERYYRLLTASLSRICLSEAEACCVCDALNGCWLVETEHSQVLWAEVADACTLNALDRKWQIDGDALVKRLRSLGNAEKLAVWDAVERFWLEPERPVYERVREVGLVAT